MLVLPTGQQHWDAGEGDRRSRRPYLRQVSDRIDAQEAWRLGLANRVVARRDLDTATQELAEKIAEVPPMTAEMMKKSINQDDPSVYHLFYADEHGDPGSDLTFFEYKGARPGRAGAGMVHRICWRVA